MSDRFWQVIAASYTEEDLRDLDRIAWHSVTEYLAAFHSREAAEAFRQALKRRHP